LHYYEAVKRVEILEKKTNSLVDQVPQLHEKDIYKEGLIISNELSTIYIEYFVKPILLKHFGYTSWQNFTNELSLLEQEIDKNQHTSILAGTSIKYEELYKPLISFLQPVQDEIEVSLTNIRYLRNDRSTTVYHKQKSINDQLEVIKKAKEFKYSEHLEFKHLVEQMVHILEQHKPHFYQLY
jgi:hypothetical protein